MTRVSRLKAREKIFFRVSGTRAEKSELSETSKSVARPSSGREHAFPRIDTALQSDTAKSQHPVTYSTPMQGQQLSSFIPGHGMPVSSLFPAAQYSAAPQKGTISNGCARSASVTCPSSSTLHALEPKSLRPNQSYSRPTPCDTAANESHISAGRRNNQRQADYHSALEAAPIGEVEGRDRDICVQSIRPSTVKEDVSFRGRFSSEMQEQLGQGFKELDQVVQKIKALTGLSERQILKRWKPTDPKDLNYWNIYQKYFRTRKEEELSRLGLEYVSMLLDKAKLPMAVIQASYKAFQKQEPCYQSILEKFWSISQIDGSNTTLNSRERDFLKFVNAMKRLTESASTINGFEAAFCAVGSVIQQDQSLSATHCSRLSSNFFSNRLRLSDNDLEGHLKAHVYDITSRTAVSQSKNQEIFVTSLSPGTLAPEPLNTGNAKESGNGRSRKQRLATVLKDKIWDMIVPCEISRLRKSRLPYSDLPTILAENGYIIENWPEDVLFPCDLPKGTGIARLHARQKELLLDAFNDKDYPVKITKKYSGDVPPTEPVITGVPPTSDSEHSRGRRRFLDEGKTVDRNGPARRVGLLEKRGSVPSSHRDKRSRMCNGDGDDYTTKKQRISV
ncbi:hypothetical protein CVT26_010486 [Gymnopilus dilepis]|uniref:Uncharacterized protein n=1 Tax=Gymnopilus dilepis TaxID=231916 RepID=A0A409Y0G0_9AGAR|nr:hypothetical protein CVT26_010486 [Gymnopilus dilepis]